MSATTLRRQQHTSQQLVGNERQSRSDDGWPERHRKDAAIKMNEKENKSKVQTASSNDGAKGKQSETEREKNKREREREESVHLTSIRASRRRAFCKNTTTSDNNRTIESSNRPRHCRPALVGLRKHAKVLRLLERILKRMMTRHSLSRTWRQRERVEQSTLRERVMTSSSMQAPHLSVVVDGHAQRRRRLRRPQRRRRRRPR